MKFYDRKKELEFLEKKIHAKSFEFGYILGRRRIGKTSLIQKLNSEKFLYLFVERGDLQKFLNKVKILVSEFMGYSVDIASIDDFLDFFFAQDKIDVLVIDEFQNFGYADKGIFSVFQKKIDQYEATSTKKIVVLGSLYSLMIDIFENDKEPLYKRGTFNLFLKELDIYTQKEILQDLLGNAYTTRDLLYFYSMFNGVPFYYKILQKAIEDNGRYEFDEINKRLFFDEIALLKNEGKEILIEEFGQKYRRLFNILEAISLGKRKRNEIMEYTGLGEGEIDHYFKLLRDTYDLIKVEYPIFEEKVNLTRYTIKDNFLRFWFAYIYANNDKFELRLYDKIFQEFKTSWNSYLGYVFESFIKEYLILKNQKSECECLFTKIGRRSDKKGNEIDLVYTDDKTTICFVEVKLNSNRINSAEISQFSHSIEVFLNKYPKFKNKQIIKKFIVFEGEDSSFIQDVIIEKIIL